jgi:FlaA1/EpsC-like NDP-sugar epimerase
MLHKISLEKFIQTSITNRKESLLAADIEKNRNRLTQNISDKSILVIGGAGTIGSHFIKALLAFLPSKVVIVDTNENGLTELVRMLRSDHNITMPSDFRTYPISLGSKVLAKLLKHEGQFDIVANFAAHKHVRSEKDMFSIEAMIENNIFNTIDLLNQLEDKKPAHFFCVSTDKAANPVNIMGASKKVMEDVLLAYGSKFKISTARFANVAFSNGSLLQGFIERLMKQQPLSVPKGISRYFVSPNESGELCMLACVLGENRDIIFPKLDEHKDLVPLTEVCTKFLAYLGLEPDYCSSEEEAKEKATNLDNNSTKYPVYFFESETSGEKSYEEFFTDQEELDLTRFVNLGIVKNEEKSLANLKTSLIQLKDVFNKNITFKSELVAALNSIIPNFSHIETGKNLDQKM